MAHLKKPVKRLAAFFLCSSFQMFGKKSDVAVAQLVEGLLPTPNDQGSNPVIGTYLLEIIEKIKEKKKGEIDTF